jgi:hypothetical protein
VTKETMAPRDRFVVNLNAGLVGDEMLPMQGEYRLIHVRDGETIAADEFPNVVCTVGKNQVLTAGVTNPFLMLISSTSFTAVSAADTMASHSGWLEAGSANAPTYSGTRPAVTFGTASGGSIVSTGTNTFSITGNGTIQGLAMTFGTGATGTIGSTAGTLLSAGTLATARQALSGDTFTATYTLMA